MFQSSVLQTPSNRANLRRKLMQGSQAARKAEASLVIPLITTTLAHIRSEQSAVRARFISLCDGAGDNSQASLPALHPLLRQKSRIYSLCSILILAVEFALATYAGSLTISGGFLLHIIVGIMATVLFTGLAKLIVSSKIDAGHTQACVYRLERQLQFFAIGTVVSLVGFFVARFFPFAETVFALTSTILSFLVAFVVATCHTLAQILGAPGREVERFAELSLLEDELSGLLALAEETATEPPSCGKGCDLGILATVLLVLCIPLRGSADEASLNLWVDGSGSMAVEEFERVRGVLSDPLPLMEPLAVRSITLAPFWSEASTLYGASQIWSLPDKPASVDCKESIFTATRRSREAECAEARTRATEQWAAQVDRALSPYRSTLAEMDVTTDQSQTCLFPLLYRVATSEGFHIIVTDGAHANCGGPPVEPVSMDAVAAVVILLPDNAGTGIATRMQDRAQLLLRLYPGITVIPSWKVNQPATLLTALTPHGA